MKKTCNKCKQEKELTEFYKDKKAKDGLRASCEVCVKVEAAAYYKANPEQVKAGTAAYSKANPDKVKSYGAAYYKANPDKLKAKNAAYRAYKKEIKQLQEEAGFETT